MNKALDLLREIRPSIPKEVLELWCKDRDAFLASHPAVEQAGGDERAACNRWIAEQQLCQGSDISLFKLERNGALVSLHELLRDAYQAGQARAALAQPSPDAPYADDIAADLERSDWTPEDALRWYAAGKHFDTVNGRTRIIDTGAVASNALKHLSLPYLEMKGDAELTELREAFAQPSPAQAEAERPEVVARVVHSNPIVLGQCGPLNANDELMTVAQHAASVARWAEMFNRVEQQRDAALARVAELKTMADNYCALLMDANAKLAELEKQEPINLQHMAVAADGELRWMTGRKIDNCELYAMPDFGQAPKLYAAPVAQAQQLKYLDKQCRDDVARALGLRPNRERGFAWSYLLASIKSCVKASWDSAQAQHSVPGKYDEVLLPFLKSMEHELHANAGKGDRPGWLQMDRKTALLEIYYHLGKLQKATKGNDTAGIVEYAADVANMSMMLVDVCGLLAAAPGKEGV
ncbi:TPA: hypothetical protein SMN85_003646 [Pseudomonas aeruginosa]|nr:hypothetical protein [Pseudomonas aeruginosa]HEK0035449.1 hypothetical protein [Pseudomonas aeruginosa]